MLLAPLVGMVLPMCECGIVPVARRLVAKGGTVLATLAQAFIGRGLLERVGQGPALSVLVMMAFAYLISVCSEADAFVASTFAATFAPGALLAFLVFGPMSDVKNTLMQLAAFRRRYVLGLNALLVALVFAAGYLFNRYG